MSTDHHYHADVADIAGSQRIYDALGLIGDNVRQLPPVTLARQAARRFALLDELDHDPSTRDERAIDGQTWLDVHTLKDRLGIDGGHRSPFWDDLELLRVTGYLQLRWDLPPLPPDRVGKSVALSVARVREVLLQHPSLRNNGSIVSVARRAQLAAGAKTLAGRLQEITGRSEGLALLVSPTRPGLRLVRAPEGRHGRP